MSVRLGIIAPVRRVYFIDETKANGYVMVAVGCEHADLPRVRSAVRALILPRQRSVHMKTEGDRRRRAIVDAVRALPIHVSLLDASGGSGREPDRRRRAVLAIAHATGPGATLVFDRDQTMEPFDRRTLSSIKAGLRPQYRHLERHEEPLLALPDVVAWCWARGGAWRARLRPLSIPVEQV